MRLRSVLNAVALSSGVLLAGAPAASAMPQRAPDPRSAPQPAAGAGAVEKLRVQIVEVKGNVEFRTGDDAPWQGAKVGVELGEGAEFRTMPKSSVTCTVGADQSFTLDRLGVVKVAQAIRAGNKIKTDLTMKYGRTKMIVEAAGREHESGISGPGGSLAVGGTIIGLFDQPPFQTQAISYTGQAHFRDAHRQVALGEKGPHQASLTADHESAADTARSNGVVDPQFGGARTRADQQYIAGVPGRGGNPPPPQSQAPTPVPPAPTPAPTPKPTGIPVVFNQPPMIRDADLVRSLPPGLALTIRWFGNADLNLNVLRTAGDPDTLRELGQDQRIDEVLYPSNTQYKVRSGGTIPYDNRGGPNGGQEVAVWPDMTPAGIYRIGVKFVSGEPVKVLINAFVNGKPVPFASVSNQEIPAGTTYYQAIVSPTEPLPGLPVVDVTGTTAPVVAAKAGKPLAKPLAKPAPKPAQSTPQIRQASTVRNGR